ncbi:MAG: DNA repair protein RadC [Candidatus Amulumruptor caecigallinarius]|nr:DNA repair protein RadC [Candidatus Amulumruptor caecigallinarius]MCM1397604.1 DNA repair protein RadC [Candidatus Amulumruptor caecigallinarius]MCM1454108.1 DNA repair protein RadC [bacterium]
MKITDLQGDLRPREKALNDGINTLSDAELMAILFGTGQPGVNVVELSQMMLDECHGRLSELARMSPGEMSRKFKGIGPAKAVTLQAALTLGARAKEAMIREGRERTQFTSPNVVYDFMWDILSMLDHEEFHLLILNRAALLKSRVRISSGGTAATVVDVKMVLRHAIEKLADSVILVHNHPSGQLRPSPQDDDLTHKIVEACRYFDIAVRDHIIVTSGGYYSYDEQGRLR